MKPGPHYCDRCRDSGSEQTEASWEPGTMTSVPCEGCGHLSTYERERRRAAMVALEKTIDGGWIENVDNPNRDIERRIVDAVIEAYAGGAAA